MPYGHLPHAAPQAATLYRAHPSFPTVLSGRPLREVYSAKTSAALHPPAEDGLYRHYEAIAQAVHIPVVLYNVPGRTGLDIPVSVYKALSALPNVIGVKEASPDIRKIAGIRRECPQDFFVWCGNDDLAVPAMALGALGVISVVSNVEPERTRAMVWAALDGDFDTASDIQLRLLPLIEALFREVNPAPVKAAMALLGYDCGQCRLPVGSIRPETLARLQELL